MDTILIAPIDLPELEVRLIASMFLLSKSQQRTYAFMHDHSRPAHILMVNADSPEALIRAHSMRAKHTKAVIVYVSQYPASEGQRYHLQRRLSINKVMQLLEFITLSEPNMYSGVSIGETNQTSLNRLQHVVIKPETSALRAAGQKKVLVVDDSPTVRKQIELGLLSYNVEIDLAETGEQALKYVASRALNQETYDLVFLDVVLPGADGYEVCKNIKRQANTKLTPIVMLTSRSSPFDRVRGALAGCDSYLTKPVENKTFQGVLQKYLTTPSVVEVSPVNAWMG